MKITKEQLKNIVRETLQEESEYQTFFKKALEKAGKSIPSMSDEEKKAFFNKIEKTWKGRGQKSEGNAFGAAVAKAKKDGDGSFEVDGKEYKTERFGRGHEGPTFGSEEESVNEAKLLPKGTKVIITHPKFKGDRGMIIGTGLTNGDYQVQTNGSIKGIEPKYLKVDKPNTKKEERELKNLAGVVKIDFSEALEVLQEGGVLEAMEHLEIAIERIKDVHKILKRKS